MKEKTAKQKKTPGQIVLRVLTITLCVIILPVIICAGYFLLYPMFHPDTPPTMFGYTPIIAKTDDMIPLFMEGDLVLIENISQDKAEHLKPKDVVCYADNGEWCLIQEIVKAEEKDGKQTYIAKALLDDLEDAKRIDSKNIIGVYKTSFQGVGKSLLFLGTTQGILIFVGGPVALILLIWGITALIDRMKTKKAKKREAAELPNDENVEVITEESAAEDDAEIVQPDEIRPAPKN